MSLFPQTNSIKKRNSSCEKNKLFWQVLLILLNFISSTSGKCPVFWHTANMSFLFLMEISECYKHTKVNPATTCTGPVVGVLVWCTVDEASQASDSVRPHQNETTERSAVHHPYVERRVEELIFWKVLRPRLRCKKSRNKQINLNAYHKDVHVWKLLTA